MKEQIEEMARVLDACPFIGASIGCDKHDGSIKIAEFLYNAGYRKQKEGEWIEKARVTKEGKVLLRHYKCNLCGVYLATQANYCPNCGSKMKGATDGSKN